MTIFREHDYLPPLEFREAAIRCPEPEREAYLAELRRFRAAISSRSFSPTEAEFDEYVRAHRDTRAALEAAKASEAQRKRFTWD